MPRPRYQRIRQFMFGKGMSLGSKAKESRRIMDGVLPNRSGLPVPFRPTLSKGGPGSGSAYSPGPRSPGFFLGSRGSPGLLQRLARGRRSEVTVSPAHQQVRVSISYIAISGSREISVKASARACATSILSNGSRWCIGRVR